MAESREVNLWHQAPKGSELAARLVVDTADHLWDSQTWRRDRARRAISAWLGREAGDLFSCAYGSGQEYHAGDVNYRTAYGILETA